MQTSLAAAGRSVEFRIATPFPAHLTDRVSTSLASIHAATNTHIADNILLRLSYNATIS
ncbi:Uncharacterised protein [Mycobacterium tuberculosis]|uniref:Uncharacterized protein n=1 Tax=Mycobacterium tuberculosis TaxID=1773 RepID=A0A655J4P8_MYCTX|nr:Uncharacterised protein [Mycobacterium tuberculosis]COW44051.1 Uncharacterised protein [Mycobacterium tuberculosis]COZ96555.1 Uncharacterised protein [Mycobacterium tuberculosis]CPA59482.1 Uncharacterised protein [Mycobacterium tuberculosis]